MVTFCLTNTYPVKTLPVFHDQPGHYTVEMSQYRNEPRHDKTNKMSVCPAKTQISQGIHPV